MKGVSLVLLALYLSTVEAARCGTCDAFVDSPACGYNGRCYTAFKNTCEIEIANCYLPEAYKIKETKFYGICFSPKVKTCTSNRVLERVSRKDRSVEFFA